MPLPIHKPLADAERKLTTLIHEIRTTPVFERVKLYVAKMTGGRLLSDYLHDDGVPVKERGLLATTLVEILLTKDYARLPELPTAAIVAPVAPPVEEAAPEELFTPAQLEIIDQRVRAAVRRELADVLTSIAKVLKG